ncbi:helix-turn-helix domain-containing protein [Staphylococcus saprophyticus]|uniref:helix-turn-helix domain-containing protein n=1 Tax=Staphylococcus saprophyticus TaxID=29385 RepID=UPI003BF6FDA3
MSNKKARPRASKELTDVLFDARKNKGYSLHQVSNKTGLSHTFISELEHGKRMTPVPEDLRKLADAFDIDYEYLMVKAGYLDEPRNNNEDEYFMFRDKDAFDSLPSEDKEKILLTLREQADFMISKYRNSKGD